MARSGKNKFGLTTKKKLREMGRRRKISQVLKQKWGAIVAVLLVITLLNSHMLLPLSVVGDVVDAELYNLTNVEEPIASKEPILAEEPTALEEPIIPEESAVPEEPLAPEKPIVSEEPTALEEPIISAEQTAPEEPTTGGTDSNGETQVGTDTENINVEEDETDTEIEATSAEIMPMSTAGLITNAVDLERFLRGEAPYDVNGGMIEIRPENNSGYIDMANHRIEGNHVGRPNFFGTIQGNGTIIRNLWVGFPGLTPGGGGTYSGHAPQAARVLAPIREITGTATINNLIFENSMTHQGWDHANRMNWSISNLVGRVQSGASLTLNNVQVRSGSVVRTWVAQGAGGLVGSNHGTVHINDSLSQTSFWSQEGTIHFGGLIGHSDNTAVIRRSVSSVGIDTRGSGNFSYRGGGFLGSGSGSVIIEDSTFNGDLSRTIGSMASGSIRAGFVTQFSNGHLEIRRSASRGRVERGGMTVGGFVGRVYGGGNVTIEQSYFAGNAVGGVTGGFIGRLDEDASSATISDSFSIGSSVGNGVIGRRDGGTLHLARMYVAGHVGGEPISSGTEGITANNVFWDQTTTRRETTMGVGVGRRTHHLITEDLSELGFGDVWRTGFNRSATPDGTWATNNPYTYPFLAWQTGGGLIAPFFQTISPGNDTPVSQGSVAVSISGLASNTRLFNPYQQGLAITASANHNIPRGNATRFTVGVINSQDIVGITGDYIIRNTEQMTDFMNMRGLYSRNGVDYRIIPDTENTIDMTSVTGLSGRPNFYGRLRQGQEGERPVVSNLTIGVNNQQNLGFIRQINGNVEMQDIIFENIRIDALNRAQASTTYLGLIGFVGDSGTVALDNLDIGEGSVLRSNQPNGVGSFIGGSNGEVSISNSLSESQLQVPTANGYFGGFIGVARGSTTIENSTSDVELSVTGGAWTLQTGGFIGSASGNVNFRYAHFRGTLSHNSNATSRRGGFVGIYQGGGQLRIERSANHGVLTSNLGQLGGFVGHVSGDVHISESFHGGHVATGTGNHANTGGFIGRIESGSARIEDSYAVGSTMGNGMLGSNGEGATLALAQVYVAGFVSNQPITATTNGITANHVHFDQTTTNRVRTTGVGTPRRTADLVTSNLASLGFGDVWRTGFSSGNNVATYPFLAWQTGGSQPEAFFTSINPAVDIPVSNAPNTVAVQLSGVTNNVRLFNPYISGQFVSAQSGTTNINRLGVSHFSIGLVNEQGVVGFSTLATWNLFTARDPLSGSVENPLAERITGIGSGERVEVTAHEPNENYRLVGFEIDVAARWDIRRASLTHDEFYIVNLQTGNFLTVAQGGNLTPVTTAAYNGSNGQRWRFHQVGGETLVDVVDLADSTVQISPVSSPSHAIDLNVVENSLILWQRLEGNPSPTSVLNRQFIFTFDTETNGFIIEIAHNNQDRGRNLAETAEQRLELNILPRGDIFDRNDLSWIDLGNRTAYAARHGWGSSTVTAIYRYLGHLTFHAVPEQISFGELPINNNRMERIAEEWQGGDLVVSDTRFDWSSWRVTAVVERELYNAEFSHTLPDALGYVINGERLRLSGGEQVIHLQESPLQISNDNLINVSDLHDWAGRQNGLSLLIEEGTQARRGTYNGTLRWTLGEVMPNE